MFRSGTVGAWDSCLDVKLWQKLWGKGTSRGGSQDPDGSLTSFLALNAWFWGCWQWRTFVVDGDPRNPEPRPLPPKGPQLRCDSSFTRGDLGLRWNKGPDWTFTLHLQAILRGLAIGMGAWEPGAECTSHWQG